MKKKKKNNNKKKKKTQTKNKILYVILCQRFVVCDIRSRELKPQKQHHTIKTKQRNTQQQIKTKNAARINIKLIFKNRFFLTPSLSLYTSLPTSMTD